MSGINFFSRTSGSGGAAAALAPEKGEPRNIQQNKSREDRIAELKQLYESGRYVVDSVQLSSAIVEDLSKRIR